MIFERSLYSHVKLTWYLLLICVLSIPLSQYISTRALGVLLLISLFQVRLRIVFARAWELLLFLFVVLIGLLYSEDYYFGLSVVESLLSLLLIPLAFSAFSGVDEGKLHALLITFVVGTGIGSLACVLSSSYRYVKTGFTDEFLYYELTRLLDFQPTYYAYFLVFSITCGLYLIYYQKSPISMLGSGLVILFLFGVLLLTGGRTAFISMLLVCAFFILKFLTERGQVWQSFALVLVVVIIVGLLITAYLIGNTTTFSDSWDRYGLWTSATLANTDILWGVGTGDFKAVLNEYFITHGKDQYASESLNAHNQFIQTYLANGALGLSALLILIFRPLYLAFRQESALTILVIFPFLIYGMTEVFLGRYQGVVFFALVHQIFTSHLLTVGSPALADEAI